MMKKRRPKIHSHPKGITLLELTFSIAFFTFIITAGLVGFVNILNIYNRGQGLTRVQLQSRNAMDSIVRDLRSTETVTHFPAGNSAGSQVAGDPLAGQAIDFYCLEGNGFSRGYASLFLANTNSYHLVRMQSCTSFTNYELLIGPDVWTDQPAGGNTGHLSQQAGRRPLQISRIGTGTPAVWSLRLSTHRGTRIPGVAGFENINDPLSAETILETVVTTRQ